MTAYIDSRLLAATRQHKIRNNIGAEVPAAVAILLLFSVLFGLVRGAGTDGLRFA
jgi:hypothetical protein